MITPISPVPAYPAQATGIKIDDVRVVLESGADCQWQLVDADGSSVSPAARCALTSEQYAAWGSDDAFFAACIIANLGLSPAA